MSRAGWGMLICAIGTILFSLAGRYDQAASYLAAYWVIFALAPERSK